MTRIDIGVECATCGKPITIGPGERRVGRRYCSTKCRGRTTIPATRWVPKEADTKQAGAILDELVARETLPPWERHPVPWTDVRRASP